MKVLNCLVCHGIFPLSQMYSADACCKEHQHILDTKKFYKFGIGKILFHQWLTDNQAYLIRNCGLFCELVD